MSESEGGLSDCESENKRKKVGLSKSASIKRAKVQGKPHVSYGGKFVPERKTGPSCR